MKRRAPNKTEKLAAVLLMLKRGEEWLVPEPIRSKGTAKQICATVHWDHLTPHAFTQDNRPQNLDPKSPAEHSVKTKPDVKAIAKSKRINPEAWGLPPQKPTRNLIPGSRGTPWKKKLSGRVERRA